MDLRLGYILLFIYCVQTVTPARLPLTKSGQQCSLQCTESKNLNYQPGKTYIYDYVGKTWINSNDGTEQLIEVKAKAHVSVISKCELSLQLENVELTGLQSDHALKRELEDRLIGFSYQDGSIASVCPSPEDSNWSINIKKAIISALQVSSTPKSGKTIVTEVDILGECETNYEAVAIPSSSNVLESIKKFKNLRNCNQRQANVFSLFPTKYSTDLNSVQNLPILNNEHSCSIEISKESIVSRVICTDSATFIPLSWTKSVTSGFNSELTLTLEASVPSKPVKPISHSHLSNRQALTFKHTLKESWANSKGDVDQVTNLLKDICSSVENQIEPKVPSQFAELVYHLRNLPSSSTSKLWLAIKRGDICPSVAKLTDLFTDALIMDGSEGSLKIIVELINEGKTAPVTVNYWLTLLAFASSPTEGSIKSLLPLIKNKSLPRQSVLGVSALVHNYCALPDVDCNSSPIVNEVTRTIASRLSYKCSVSPGAEDDTIVALKGLANIAPYLSNGEIRSILECSVNSNSLHVRVTAIETLQSLSCLDSVAPTMMDLFTSTEHDAEIRIAAYKNVIACPSASKIEAIILTLENEPSVQVGSYIVSHLSNIQESSDPLKSEMKLYLTGIKIPLKSFPRDIRKFSRYYELSQHFSKINLGAVIESDVIFDGSYIPRSIKANLSIPMFGSSVNLAEVGFRQKGLESSIEGLFGPSGSLNGKNWKEILESLASLLINENDPNEIEANRYRLARRSVQDIFRPIKLESLVKKATITSAPVEGSMYLKVDGKTIIYLSVNDIKKESYKSMFDSKLENVVKSSKYDRAFSFMVLDSIHQFPGINGFPIKLDINSTAIFGYKQTGKTFYPSFASELSVKVGFDARTSQPGLKWKTIVSSAPALSAEIEYKNQIPTKVTFSLPEDSLTLFHYQSDLISVSTDGSEKSIQAPYSRHHEGCTKSFTKPFGIEFCGALSVPKPLFTLSSPFIPFNGPINFDIVLRKTDVTMKGWTFFYQVPSENKIETRVYSIGFLTPESTINRQFSADLSIFNTIDDLSKEIKVKLVTPYKRMDAFIGRKIDDKSILVRGEISIDSKKDYSAMVKLDKYDVGRDLIYQGEAQVQLSASSSPYNIKSTIMVKEDNTIVFDLKPKQGVAFINGTLGLAPPRFDIDGNLRYIVFRLSNTVTNEKSSLRNNFHLSYRHHSSNKFESFTLASSLKTSLSGTIHKYITKVEGSATKWPKNSFLATWESSYAPWELIENDFTFEIGKKAKGYASKSKITQISRFNGLTGDYSDVYARNTLTIDVAGFYYKAGLIGSKQMSSSSSKAKIEFTGGNRMSGDSQKVTFSYGIELEPLLRFSSSALIRLGPISVDYVDSVSERSKGKYSGSSELMVSRSTFWTLNYNYSVGDDNRLRMSRNLEMSVSLPRYGIDFIQEGSFDLNNDELSLTSFGASKQSKLWSINSKISQTAQSIVKVNIHRLAELELDLLPYAPNRLGSLKLVVGDYTSMNRFALYPSSFSLDSELQSKSSLVYQISGHYKSINKWSTTIITSPVVVNLVLNPQNGKFDVKLTNQQIHHLISFSNEPATFSLSSEIKKKSKQLMTLKADYQRAGAFIVEFASKPIEFHSEANFKSANRFEIESVLNLKSYSQIFTIEGSKVNKDVKLNLSQRGAFTIKLYLESMENLKLNFDLNDCGTTAVELTNKPELKAFALNCNYPSSGWEQSTLIQHAPEVTTIFSSTQRSSQRLLLVNGRISDDKTALDVKYGDKDSFYAEWLSSKSVGSTKLALGQYLLNHDSSISFESNKLVFSSLTTKSNKQLLKINLDSDLSSALELTMSSLNDHSIKLSYADSKALNIEFGLNSRSYSIVHSSKFNYPYALDRFDFKSVTSSKGVDLLTIKATSARQAPTTLEIYSKQVTGTIQFESSYSEKRYALKMIKPLAVETEFNYKPRSSQYSLYSVVKKVSSGEQLFEIDAKIQPNSKSSIDVNVIPMKGRLTYSHLSSLELTFDNGAGYNHLTTINVDSRTSNVDFKSSSSSKGSIVYQVDAFLDLEERINLKVIKNPWDGSIEINVANAMLTASLVNQAKSLVHSTKASFAANSFTLTSDTKKSERNLFSLDCLLSTNSKSEIKVSSSSWSSTSILNTIGSSYSFQFNLKRPSISSDYNTKIVFDKRSSTLKMASYSQRKGVKSTIESEISRSNKSWFKYASPKNGRIDWEVSPFGSTKISKISVDWKPSSFIHNSEVKYDSQGLKVKSTSSQFAHALYTFNGEIGKINGQLSRIELNFDADSSSYRHASSYSWTKDVLNLQSKSTVNRETLWDFKGVFPLNAQQTTSIDLDSPQVLGKVTFDPDSGKFIIEAYLRQSQRKIILTTNYGFTIDSPFSFDLNWDADRNNDARIYVTKNRGSTDSSRRDILTIGYGSEIKAMLTVELGSEALVGPHYISMSLDLPNAPSRSLSFNHEMTSNKVNCAIRFHEDNQVVHQLVHEMTMESKSFNLEIGTKSRNPTFDGLHLSYKCSHAANSIASELKVQPSSGSPYSVKLNAEFPVSRSEKSLVAKILAKTPINNYRHQGLTINFNLKNDLSQSNVNIKYSKESSESAAFTANYMLKSSGGSVSLSLDGSLAGVYDGSNLKGQFDNRSNKKSLSLESNILTVGELNLVATNQRGAVEGQVTLSSPKSSRYTFALKTNTQTLLGSSHEVTLTQDNLELFDSKLSLDYGKPLLGKISVTSKGSELLRFEVNRYDVSNEESKFIADYFGPKGPLKVNLNLLLASTQSRVDLQVCPSSQCYNLKLTDSLNQWGRESAISYRNGAYSKVYRASYVLKSEKNIFIASGSINLNGIDFGGEMVSSSSNSIGKINLGQRVIEARFYQYPSKIMIEFLADARREPGSKVTLEIDGTYESVPSRRLINVDYKIRLGSPSLYRPISITFLLKRNPADKKRPFDSKIVFDLGKSESQSLVIESYLENVSGKSNNQTVALKVYQPNAKLNVAVKGHFASTNTKLSTGLTWSWTDDYSRSQQVFNLLAINSETKEISFITHGGSNDISGRAQYQTSDQSIDLIGEMSVNGVKNEGKLSGSLEGNCAFAKAFSGNNLKRKIEACLEPYRLVRINSQRFDYGSSPSTDLSLILSQRNGKVLKAMVNIDPNYSQQLESITWPSLNLRKSQWNGLPSTMTVNWQIFSDIYQPMGQSIMEESFEFVGELDQHTLPVRSFFSEYVSLPSISLPTINFYPLVDRLSAWADEMSTKAAVQLKSVCRYKSSCYRIAHAYERYGMDGLTRIASDNWRVYKISLKNWFQNITSKVLRASDDMYESILSYFNNLSSKLWSSQYGSILTKKLHQISKFPCRLTKSISSGVQRFYSNLNRRVMSNPDVRALVNIIVSLYREISSELAKINIKSSLKSSASQYNYLLSPSTWGASARYTTWNPAKGFYEAEIVSPVDIGTVKSTLRSSQKSVSDINDSLNSLKASLWTELTPPFKSTAFLIGGQHFVTFDGRSFDLGTTDCSYLLARDFVNSNFSVIVRYHGGNKKSFLITLGEEQVIEINPSEKRVKLGRNIVELPVIQGSLSILRHHQTIVLEDSSNGLTFKCFLSRDLCSLTVSGWYFGRTKGLFGTYDYEPSNDYLLPDGRQAANPNDLASGWEVEGSCANPSGVPIQSEEIRRSSKAYRLCEKTFSSSESPLAEGFQYVSPDFYFLMCRRHMAATKGQDRPEKALCNIAGAYVEQVRANGFELSMPLACLTCEAGQEFGSRYVASPTRSSSRADVVFIIEERPCNAKLINDLPNLARNMHKELEQSGLKDPRFGVVAFGGPAVNTREAHGHTARGELLFPYQDIAMSTKRMELAPIDSYDANYTDALSAIVLASQYPFRKAASKNLVLLSCRACDERTSRFDYNDIQHLLLSEGITLHVVSNQRFSTKRATSKTREILGIDRRSVQRASDIRANEVSDERVYLRDSITVPKDVCISLAHLSNGSFYPSPLVTSLDHRLEKLWSLGLARRLASTADPSPCQHCDCVPDSDLLHSKILCRPCRPLKPVY
ncbi:uncharacterized protein LOC107366951 [Tetranychus urticae]|uniref:uncharacterized protein LOC107366951 n=1 Tax=Tetranychus urticae TaxID=32264 RepID=UPI0003561B85|nr:uncharacterized protein LOC107366951 [Tetranychus urticae]